MANQQTGHQYITKIAAEHIIGAQEVKDLEEQLSSVHISEEWLEYQEKSEEQDEPEIKSKANKIGNEEELNELSDVLSVGQPKQNMSRTQAGTPVLVTRIALVPAPTEVVNHKSMVPEPEWFNRNRKTFKDWQKAIKLYLRANKVTDVNKKIIAVLGRF